MPESGWKVFKVRTAEGSRFGGAVDSAVVVAAEAVSFGFDLAFVLGFLGREYLVVIRVEG